MKNNRLYTFILIILLIVAGVYYFSNTKGSLGLRSTSFAIKETDKVTKIRISSGQKELILEQGKGQWSVNNKYFVSDWAITNFLKAIQRIEVKQPVSKTIEGQVASLLKTDGLFVELKTNGRAVKRYYVSKPSMNREKTYMLMYRSRRPFVVNIPAFHGLVSGLFVLDENYWMDKTIFNYQPQNIKYIRVEYPGGPGRSFEISNTRAGKITLKTGQNIVVDKFDLEKGYRYFTYFQRISFDEKVSGKILSELPPAPVPFIIITVETFDGTPTKLSVFRKPPTELVDEFGEKPSFDYNKAYARLNDNEEFVFIQYYKFDPLFKDLDYFELNKNH